MRAVVMFIGLASIVTVLGCDIVGDDAFDLNAPLPQRNATPADLQNMFFQFANGGAFDVSPPPDDSPVQEVTLTFGDFEADGDGDPNTGPFTLESEGLSAGGTVTIGSCTFSFTFSDFPPEVVGRPQADDVIIMNPCRIVDAIGSLDVTNVETEARSVSGLPMQQEPAAG